VVAAANANPTVGGRDWQPFLGRLVRLTIWTGNYHGVAVGIGDPDFPMTWTVALALRRIAMGCPYDRRIQLAGASDDVVELRDFTKPQQDAIADCNVRAGEEPMMVFNISTMELKDQSPVSQKPFVLRPTMITAKAEELLIPAAGRLDVAYCEHRLRLSCANAHHDADPVSGRVVDLDEPALPAVELGAVVDCATVGGDSSEGLIQVAG
jgi:hypothetical protein